MTDMEGKDCQGHHYKKQGNAESLDPTQSSCIEDGDVFFFRLKSMAFVENLLPQNSGKVNARRYTEAFKAHSLLP